MGQSQVTLLDACREVMGDPLVVARYPDGLASSDVLYEIRRKHGLSAFPGCSILDVANEMQAFYGSGVSSK